MCRVSHKVASELPFLRLAEIEYLDTKDPPVQRKWSLVERTTATTGDNIVGTAIVAIVREGTKQSIVSVAQYRPPIDAFSVEFPAGLVDEGESVEQTAVRELKEETGYIGKVTGVSPVLAAEPGITNACYQVVHVDIDGSLPENKNPQHSQEDVEDILTFLVPLGPSWNEELSKILAEKLPGKKVVLDGRYWSFLAGTQFTHRGPADYS